MGKPKAPKAPDYAAAAREQGVANVNSALATSYLNQLNQVGPEGTLTYKYGSPGTATYDPKTRQWTGTGGDGQYLPDGTFIPNTTVETKLSPEQQKLYDQNIEISQGMNDTAIKGLQYADRVMDAPLDINGAFGALPTSESYGAQRDQVTQALLERMRPEMDRDAAALRTQLANQGIGLGSEAYSAALSDEAKAVNDARLAAVLAGGQEQERLFNIGLASRQQGIQELDYQRNSPINVINALRTGNQVSMPQFQNRNAGATIDAAPIYASVNDKYNADVQAYNTKMQGYGAMLSGLGKIGGAAIGKWGK